MSVIRIYFFDRKKTGLLLAMLLILTLACFATGNLRSAAVMQPERDGVELVIIMYHSLLKDEGRAGQYIISPNNIESDLIYLKEHGYNTIFMQELINYVYYGVGLPDKPVMITLDDGYLNNMTYLLPLLQKHEMKAVVSVVGEFTDRFTNTPDRNANYAHMTWADISFMAASGYVEIQNHSYCLHGQGKRVGAGRLKGETETEYENALTADILLAQQKLKDNCGVVPTTFTYPFGFISAMSDSIMKRLGFLATLSCYEHKNYIVRDPECLYSLGRYNRPGTISTEKFMKRVNL